MKQLTYTLTCLLLLISLTGIAQPGSSDLTFSGDGKTTTGFQLPTVATDDGAGVANTSAQDKSQNAKSSFSFNAGFQISVPTGDFTENNSIGVGPSFEVHYSITGKWVVTALAGYTYYFGKGFYKNSGLNMIPVCVGVNFYPVNKFYLGCQLGVVAFFYDDPFFGTLGNADFYIAPQAGYEITKHIITTLKFENTPDDGGFYSTTLRVAYKFK